MELTDADDARPSSGVRATAGDLALGLARLEGKLDALTQTTTLQINAFNAALNDSTQDRRDLNREVDSLKTWRAWLTGVGVGLSLVSFAAAFRAFGFHP